MGKNRIKNLRTINVDGEEYKWMVEQKEYGKQVKIWRDSNEFYKDYVYEDKITPSTIRDIIEEKMLEVEE